jgi:hypothetical protein
MSFDAASSGMRSISHPQEPGGDLFESLSVVDAAASLKLAPSQTVPNLMNPALDHALRITQ